LLLLSGSSYFSAPLPDEEEPPGWLEVPPGWLDGLLGLRCCVPAPESGERWPALPLGELLVPLGLPLPPVSHAVAPMAKNPVRRMAVNIRCLLMIQSPFLLQVNELSFPADWACATPRSPEPC
jgi:hypothetical protein